MRKGDNEGDSGECLGKLGKPWNLCGSLKLDDGERERREQGECIEEEMK